MNVPTPQKSHHNRVWGITDAPRSPLLPAALTGGLVVLLMVPWFHLKLLSGIGRSFATYPRNLLLWGAMLLQLGSIFFWQQAMHFAAVGVLGVLLCFYLLALAAQVVRVWHGGDLPQDDPPHQKEVTRCR